jgi:hypothetical protein
VYRSLVVTQNLTCRLLRQSSAGYNARRHSERDICAHSPPWTQQFSQCCLVFVYINVRCDTATQFAFILLKTSKLKSINIIPVKPTTQM